MKSIFWRYVIFSAYLLFPAVILKAQNYQAFYGSDYFGSLNVSLNPASALNNPYKWDLTLFSGQYSIINNAVVPDKHAPLNLPFSYKYKILPGNYDRAAFASTDLHILNGRYSLNSRHAIGFGANIRGYGMLKSEPFFYHDSITTTSSFFKQNSNTNVHLNLAESSWLEFYGSYATTILNNQLGKANAGISIKLLKGLSSVLAEVADVEFVPGFSDEGPDVFIRKGRAYYGYSDTHEPLQNNGAPIDVLRKALPGFSIDLGVEFILNAGSIISFNDGVSSLYSWKFGVAVLDLGWNNFRYHSASREFADLHSNINGIVANNKVYDVQSIEELGDSLATMVRFAVPLTGNYKVFNPARLVLNADHRINEEISVNANLSVSLTGMVGGRYAVSEKQLLTITPRWEKKNIGLYLPVQINSRGNFWLGGAARFGPVFMGLHNIPNALFGKDKPLNGGGFLGIVIRPFHKNAGMGEGDIDCPEIRL